MNTESIRNTLLTVSFGISAWEARKQDKRASAEVAAAHGTDSGVGRYHKDLLPDATEHQEVLKIRNAWRVWHYENTLAWGDDGQRVMRSASFFDYAEGYRLWEQKWLDALHVFYAAYPTLVATSELRLNTLFNPADYPDVEEVKRRFSVRFNTYPLPNADDFRVMEGIAPEEAENMRLSAIEGVQAQISDALKDLWARMHKVTAAMHERLSIPAGAKGGKFHDTLVTNIEDVLAVLPKLNLTNDPDIAAMGQMMETLVAAGPETLRTAPDLREQTARKAAELAKKMACFVG